MTIKDKNLWQCEICKMNYRDVETASKCEVWCRDNKSCNLEIINKAIIPIRDESYKDYILDLLGDWEGIYAKPMFGGWGLYHDDIILGIISNDELYFKVDDSNKSDYKKKGSRPFTYKREGKDVALSYWLVPEEVLENRDVLSEWSLRSLDINKKLKSKASAQDFTP